MYQSKTKCIQDEADTRGRLHLYFAALNCHKKAYLRTVDTDWVANATYINPKLELTELWIGFGTGKTYRDIPIHEVCRLLGNVRCNALPLFHSLSGCDVSSGLYGIGKKKAWQAWEVMGDELTQTLINIQENPTAFSID